MVLFKRGSKRDVLLALVNPRPVRLDMYHQSEAIGRIALYERDTIHPLLLTVYRLVGMQFKRSSIGVYNGFYLELSLLRGAVTWE